MAGTIGGFPVHNYGSDVLKDMSEGMESWERKRKELEAQAQAQAVKQQYEGYLKTVEGGTATPDVGSKLYGPEVGGGLDRLSQQNQATEEIKRLSSIIKMNTDKQTYDDKQISNYEKAQEKMIKQKDDYLRAGGHDEDIVHINDGIQSIDRAVSKIRGFSIGDSVKTADLASWKTTKQEEATKQIAALGKELNTAMGATTPDPEAIAAASAKLQAAVTTMQQKWNIPKETFTLESTLLTKSQETMKQVVQDKLKPKEPKPTFETRILEDGTRIQVESGTGKENLVQGRTPREPVSDDIALQRKAKYISTLMKIPEAEAAQMILQGKQQTKAQFVSKIVQDQMALITPGKSDPRLKQTIIEAGKLYDFIHGQEAVMSPSGLPGTAPKQYIWDFSKEKPEKVLR